MLSTPYDDVRAGAEAAREAVAELGLVADEPLQQYVNGLGQRLARAAPARGFVYRFHVVDQWPPNAFSLPGGAIFVSRGLLALSNSEDELANVLAHEIMHAAQRHAAGRQAVGRGLSPFSLGWLGAAQVAAYARDQERSADADGQRLAASAGFDPRAMGAFLRSLEKIEILRMGAARLPTFLDTHPGATERVAATATLAQQITWTPRPDALDRAAYLRRLDGLVLGENPSQGILRDGRFLHPDLDLAVNFPDGWRVDNGANAVVALSPDADARFALQFAGRGDDPRAPAAAFLAGPARIFGAQISEAQPLQLGCCAAYQVRGHVATREGGVSAQLTWLTWRGNLYLLSAAALGPVAQKYFGRARAMARSFRPLSAEERSSIEVERLRVALALEGETLPELLARTGSSWDVQRVAIANDVVATASLGRGDLLKIAVREPYAPASPSPGSAKSEEPR
ncbi:MAG TPA: M48 family metalloprotease [Myxococcota bacterium]|nr:M48 family metalloprotease [Myxococcota bacterium]